MTTKDDYTTEEWLLLVKAPTKVAAGVVVAHPTPTSIAKEFRVIARSREKALEKFERVTLLREVLAGTNADDDPASGGGKPDKLLATAEEVLQHVANVVEILKKKATPFEAEQFKEMLLWYAQRVAEASGEKLLGTGKKVSDREKMFIRAHEKQLADS